MPHSPLFLARTGRRRTENRGTTDDGSVKLSGVRPRTGPSIPLLILLILFAAWSSPGASGEASKAERRGLRVLLTNDDGIDAIGLIALKEALREAGHRVTVMAPEQDRSGSSAAMSFAPVRVRQVAPREWAAEATPATAALLGLSAFKDPEGPFDLVVSGINRGANVGAATAISGTVGATTAVVGFAGGQSAIALSADPIEAKPGDPRYRQHFDDVADFAVRLIDALRRSRAPNSPLLPPGVRLNVNHPALAPEEIEGVRVVRQGLGSRFSLAYEANEDGLYVPRFERAERRPTAERDDDDSAAFSRGFITIVPLDTNYTAS